MQESLNTSDTEYKQAVNFLSKILGRLRNNPGQFMQFRDIFYDFQIKQQRIYKTSDSEENIKSIIKTTRHRIIDLLKNNRDLIQDFLYFLPEITKNEEPKPCFLPPDYKDIIEYRIRVIKELKELVPRKVYKRFLRILNLFAKKIVSYKELLVLFKQLLIKSYPEYLNQLLEALEPCAAASLKTRQESQKRESQQASGEKRVTPSYVEIRSDQTEKSENGDVLNRAVVSMPRDKDDANFYTNIRSHYEERVLLFEDDRYEVNVLISINNALIAKFEAFMKEQCSNGRVRPSDELLQVELSSLERKSVSSFYGSKGAFVLNLLDLKPSSAVPVILRRCRKKQEEWNHLKEMFSSCLRKVCVNRWLHQLADFKAPHSVRFQAEIDKNYLLNELSNAVLYNEIYTEKDISPSSTEFSTNHKLAEVLRSHAQFLANVYEPRIPEFLTPRDKLLSNETHYVLSFPSPQRSIRSIDLIVNLTNVFFSRDIADSRSSVGASVDTPPQINGEKPKYGVYFKVLEKLSRTINLKINILPALKQFYFAMFAAHPNYNNSGDKALSGSDVTFYATEKWYDFVRIYIKLVLLIDNNEKLILNEKCKNSPLLLKIADFLKLSAISSEDKFGLFTHVVAGDVTLNGVFLRFLILFQRMIQSLQSVVDCRESTRKFLLFKNYIMCLKDFWGKCGDSVVSNKRKIESEIKSAYRRRVHVTAKSKEVLYIQNCFREKLLCIGIDRHSAQGRTKDQSDNGKQGVSKVFVGGDSAKIGDKNNPFLINSPRDSTTENEVLHRKNIYGRSTLLEK